MKNRFLGFIAFVLLLSCTKNDTIRFALFSDTHVAENTTGAVDLRLAVKDVNSMGDIDFVLVSGDITDMNIGDNLRLAKQILDSLEMPYYIIPGNHDTKWSGSAGANFRQLWVDDQFVFDFDKFRFIGFHQGPILRMDDGHIPREDLEWLKDQLEYAGRDKPIILVMHYALTSSIDNWHECVDIIKNYDIKVIIHGHGHRSRLHEYQGIPGLMGRSTLRAGDKRGGFNIFEIRNDSLFAREKLTGGESGAVWASLDISKRNKIQVVADSLLADMSVNSRFKEVKPAWNFESGYTTTASPVFDQDAVYIADVSGKLVALDLENGKKMWEFTSGAAVYGTASVSGKNIVFNSADSFIYCIDKDTKSLSWRVKTNNALVAVPGIHNDIVYTGSSDGVFRAIDIHSGEIVWEFDNVGSFVETKPLFYDEKIIFGGWDGKLYALNAADGSASWIWQGGKTGPLYSPAACWPVAAHGKVFIAAPDRFITAIDAKTGKTIWRNNDWKFRETVGISEDGNRIYARSMTDSVVCFNSKSDKPDVIWANDFAYGYDIAPSMPMEKDGTLFWGTKNGLIIASDARSGKLKWKHRINNYLINTVTPVDGESVLFSNIDGTIGLLTGE